MDRKRSFARLHVWELPMDKVYIQLKKEFREKFFDKAHDLYGSWNKLGECLNVKRGDTSIARNWKKGKSCFPLRIAFRISQELKTTKTKIEKNIVIIKYKTDLRKRGGNSGKPITNPKLPIEVNEDFVEILGHICGDGTICKGNIKKGIRCGYTNSEPTLIKHFKVKMKEIFGDIEPTIQIRKDKSKYNRPNFYLSYPSIVSLLILSIFNYEPYIRMNIPQFIFDCPYKFKCKFLRAIFDDEGTVSVKRKRIRITLKPRPPLKDIRELLISLGINASKIYCSGGQHKLDISKQGSVRLFRKLVGFKHPLKNKKLNLIIKRGWKFERYSQGVTQRKILLMIRKKEGLHQKK